MLLILIMAIIDMFGIASVLPFIGILSNPQLIETNNYIQKIYNYSNIFGVSNSKQFLFFLGLASFLFLIISLIFRAITQYVQVRFSLMREYSIGKRLLEGYLNQPYIWFINRNSADLSKSILSEVNQIVSQALLPLTNVFVQVSVILALLALLIFIDPFLALSTGAVLILTYSLIFFIMKNLLSRLGSDRVKANQERFIAVSEAFGTTKELKVMALERYYLDYFSKPAKIYARNQSIAMTIGMLPRYLIEAIAFGGVIILVLTLISRDKNFANIVPIITVYAFAGYRLIPALQQIYVSLTKIRFSKLALDSLNKDLKYLDKIKKNSEFVVPMSLKESIKLDNVYFKYPNSKSYALKKINIHIPVKNKIGIIGLTGGGKTTLIDIILGLLSPSEGNLKIDDNSISVENIRSWQKIIGYVPQQIFLIDNSIAANIALGVEKKNINEKQLEHVAKIANLHQFIISELPNGYETIIGERGVRLSGGQRQRVAIARALYKNPQVLILDEATNSLDNSTEDAVMEAVDILNKNITIILIAHRLSTVKNCDKIYLVDKGIIKAEGNFNEVSKIII